MKWHHSIESLPWWRRWLHKIQYWPLMILAYVLLAGCGPKPIPPKIIVERIVETVEVKVPTLVARVPPPELVAPLDVERPVFVSPSDPEASSALTTEGERIMRALIVWYQTRIAAWETWATAPP